jgi:hypothetical protein
VDQSIAGVKAPITVSYIIQIQKSARLRFGMSAFAKRECAVVQILSIVAIGLGLAASAAWTGFLGFQMFRVIGLMF